MKHFFLGVAVMAAATFSRAAEQAPLPPQAPRVSPAPTAAPFRQRTEKEVFNHIRRSTVVVTHSLPGRGFSGSGTVIRKEGNTLWVLTCSHIAERERDVPGSKVTVKTFGGTVYPAEWCYWNHSNKRDLAIVKAKVPDGAKPDCEVAELATSEDYATDKWVLKSGYPGDTKGKHSLYRGQILGVRGYKSGYPDISILHASAMSREGDSGGGLWRYDDGKLIGVVWGRDGDYSASLSTTLKDIRWFLSQVDEREARAMAEAEAEEGVSARSCPVRGGTCPCGCRDGDPCTCAANKKGSE